jgi:hypothetical protein
MSPGYFLQQDINYALGSVAVPERGNPARFALARQGVTGGSDYFLRISANQQISAVGAKWHQANDRSVRQNCRSG